MTEHEHDLIRAYSPFTDLNGQATRAASVILAQHNIARSVSYDTLVELMAIAWLEGRTVEARQTLEDLRR